MAAGIPAVTFWAAVPHFGSQLPNPKATVALLQRVEDALDIEVPLADLPAQAEEWEQAVTEMTAEDDEISEYVQSLEQRGDAEVDMNEALGKIDGDALGRRVRALPTPPPARLGAPAEPYRFSNASLLALVDRPSAATSASIRGNWTAVFRWARDSPNGVDRNGFSQRNTPTQLGQYTRSLRPSMPAMKAVAHFSTEVVLLNGHGNFANCSRNEGRSAWGSRTNAVSIQDMCAEPTATPRCATSSRSAFARCSLPALDMS